MSPAGRRCVSCFDKRTEELIKEIPFVGITLRDLQEIFGMPEDDEMIEVFDITPRHAQRLQKFLPEPLELDKYDYQLECYAPR